MILVRKDGSKVPFMEAAQQVAQSQGLELTKGCMDIVRESERYIEDLHAKFPRMSFREALSLVHGALVEEEQRRERR